MSLPRRLNPWQILSCKKKTSKSEFKRNMITTLSLLRRLKNLKLPREKVFYSDCCIWHLSCWWWVFPPWGPQLPQAPTMGWDFFWRQILFWNWEMSKSLFLAILFPYQKDMEMSSQRKNPDQTKEFPPVLYWWWSSRHRHWKVQIHLKCLETGKMRGSKGKSQRTHGVLDPALWTTSVPVPQFT